MNLREQATLRIPRRRILTLLPAALGSVALQTLGRGRAAGVAGSEASLHVLATADSGSGDPNQRAVGLQMGAVHRRDPVDLVLMGGDNIYPSGDLALVEATFNRPYRELLAAGVPFHAVLGNHDIRTGNGNPQVAYPPFGMKGRWYSLRRGPVAFFLLDTNVNAPWQHQLPWLKRELAASDAPWKVVVGHHPLYSSGLYGNDPAAIARLAPLFRRHGVQLYINGHDHNYERSKPLQGTTYLTVGGGGATLRPVKAEAQSARALSVHSFAELLVQGERLTITAWDLNGSRIDSAVLNPAGAVVPG
ncbi:metallophosphoesterase [Cyanobium sp. FGCU-6]|jgi:3',5'-cyclic AMP phosphodiesterase CpdA|nr:metallophosphoesterase [Cyanobium sp. FGCU6]